MTTLTQTTDKVNFKELELKVKNVYRDVALKPEANYHFEMGRALAERLGYPSSQLDHIPEDAIKSFAGVGYHFKMANITPGDHVVDLGSGSGMDAFLAALETDEIGKVTGIDMTFEQLEKAEELKKQYGFQQVEFVKGYIEDLPLESESADIVISNGVINLSARKAKVFREASRVLKQGGRFAISDIVTSIPLSKTIKSNAELWAACIGGAMHEEEYLDLIVDAGFKIVHFKTNPYEFLSGGAKGATKDYGIQSISLLAINQKS
jgi:ubiquinone/menaquinone biosynthesis C-methylase UbiE